MRLVKEDGILVVLLLIAIAYAVVSDNQKNIHTMPEGDINGSMFVKGHR